MTSFAARSGRCILWVVVSVMISLAVAVTALRIALPRLDRFQTEISYWVGETSGLPFSIGEVKGYWRNTHPSLSLKQLSVKDITEKGIDFQIEEVEIEFDLIQSFLTLKPQVAQLNAKGLLLDTSSVNLFHREDRGGSSVTNNQTGIEQIDRLFFRQLDDFNLINSKVSYQNHDGEQRTLDIEQLRWTNEGRRHRLDGTVSILGSHFNSLNIKADFEDDGSLRNISGDFYLHANNIRITPWLASEWVEEKGIESGYINLNSWFTFENSKPKQAYVEILPSELIWKTDKEHLLEVEQGILKLSPDGEEGDWKVSAHSLEIRSDGIAWPELDLAFKYTDKQWLFNASQLDVKALRPLAELMPNSLQLPLWLQRLDPTGTIEDIRVSQRQSDGAIEYSAELSHGGIKQWELLPEVHDLSALIAGRNNVIQAEVSLFDDVLPYGDVFQAPLRIKSGEADVVLQFDDSGWKLWADRVTAATPDLQVQGEFRLDFPNDASPFLSFYAEADAYNAGETWRYLPTLALGQDLTDYLSTAIQGGKAENAQILWYGPVDTFPYVDNDGIFQAKAALKDTKFSFDTQWPIIEEMQLNLLFENDSMYLESQSAKLMGVKGEQVTGQIAELGPNGAVEIKARAVGKGKAVRDYMMATPLVDSVGAALTASKVSGDVSAEFQLFIPFDEDSPARAWGFADLSDNAIKIETPPMELAHATGRISFDDDVVSASGLSAELLEQPISIDFKGENLDSSYSVAIDLVADWEVAPLASYIGQSWTDRVQGHAPWNMDIDLQLDDIGFTYQIDSQANLTYLDSSFPQPLTKSIGEKSKLHLQASGNQETISARLQLPDVKFQTEIDITEDTPVLEATNLLIGKGGFKVSPVVGHHMTIRIPSFDIDKWIEIEQESLAAKEQPRLSEMNTPTFPYPRRFSLTADTVKFASLDWHNVDFSARKKGVSWLLDVDSSEVKGQANYLEPYDLSVSLDHLHLFLPALEQNGDEDKLIYQAEEEAPLITEFDQRFHQEMPNLTLNIKDFWLQGYKLGKVALDLQRQGDRLSWQNIDISSGSNQFKANGWWELTEIDSRSVMNMFIKGDNNTELMDRFGISSGIQKAPFEVSSALSWQGAPWSLKVNTLAGDVKASFGKGIISDVSGAAKLLGLFSLDSIIRKMQLDFTDIFDNGMAFDSITGTGKIEQGVFVTNDIEMDAVAGGMTINGMADLNTKLVDAEVEFTPDLTSGIPVLTAFAVTPQTAVVVFAISTVISPVVDVFTKIRYQVVGPLDSPEVKELSRSKGEYTLPSAKNKDGN